MTHTEFERLVEITRQVLKIAGELEDAGNADTSQKLAKIAVDLGILALSNGRDTEQEIAGKLYNALVA